MYTSYLDHDQESESGEVVFQLSAVEEIREFVEPDMVPNEEVHLGAAGHGGDVVIDRQRAQEVLQRVGRGALLMEISKLINFLKLIKDYKNKIIFYCIMDGGLKSYNIIFFKEKGFTKTLK